MAIVKHGTVTIDENGAVVATGFGFEGCGVGQAQMEAISWAMSCLAIAKKEWEPWAEPVKEAQS